MHYSCKAADDYMMDRDVSDAALIVKTEADLNSTINYLIDNSYIRTMVIEWDNSNSNERLEKINPAPTTAKTQFFVIRYVVKC